jgi:hypothetical protein
MAELDPDQEAALRRWAAFGFVEVLWVVDHHDGQVRTTTSSPTRASKLTQVVRDANRLNGQDDDPHSTGAEVRDRIRA